MTNTASAKPLSILRIYLRRQAVHASGGFWGRLFGRPFAHDLAERALKGGVTYATVTLGHVGFVSGAKRLVGGVSEVQPGTLPTCVELVGSAEVLEQFVAANDDELADAILLRLDGVRIARRGIST